MFAPDRVCVHAQDHAVGQRLAQRDDDVCGPPGGAIDQRPPHFRMAERPVAPTMAGCHGVSPNWMVAPGSISTRPERLADDDVALRRSPRGCSPTRRSSHRFGYGKHRPRRRSAPGGRSITIAPGSSRGGKQCAIQRFGTPDPTIAMAVGSARRVTALGDQASRCHSSSGRRRAPARGSARASARCQRRRGPAFAIIVNNSAPRRGTPDPGAPARPHPRRRGIDMRRRCTRSPVELGVIRPASRERTSSSGGRRQT
jgi:hypothetical protein